MSVRWWAQQATIDKPDMPVLAAVSSDGADLINLEERSLAREATDIG